MTTTNTGFAPNAPATRLQVARALMLASGMRVPQYLPDSPTYSDVSGINALFAESIAHSPSGNLLNIVGGQFNPNAMMDRQTLAVALVKALGLESEAQTASLINPGLLDWLLIPLGLRGYISVVVSRGLMAPRLLGLFRPQEGMTRMELANTAVALLKSSR
jgi:hypothetical protein